MDMLENYLLEKFQKSIIEIDSLEKNFMEKMEKLFDVKEFSDVEIQIIEIDNFDFEPSNSLERKKKKDMNIEKESDVSQEETLFCTLHVHCNILHIFWEYFKVLLEWSTTKEKTVVQLKVNKGEGYYLKMFIKSFYSYKALEEMKICEFLHTVEMADRYSSDLIIEIATTLIPLIKIDEVKECDYVGQRISLMCYGLATMKKFSESLMVKCVEYLTEFFCPLEKTSLQSKGEFINLSFNTFFSLLKSHKPLCYDENSLLWFTIVWLENDPSRQTSENIKLLLQEINCNKLSVDYLMDIITDAHPVLSKFVGYTNWFITTIGNLSLAQSRPYQNNVSQPTHRSLLKGENLPSYQLLFQKVKSNLYKSLEKIVYNGYLLQLEMEFEVRSWGFPSGNKKVADLDIKCLNYRGNRILEEEDAESFLNYEIALVIRYGEQNKNDIFPHFCCVDDDDICHSISYVCVGSDGSQCGRDYIAQFNENYLDGVDSFHMFLVMKNEKTKWPDSFPRKLRDDY